MPKRPIDLPLPEYVQYAFKNIRRYCLNGMQADEYYMTYYHAMLAKHELEFLIMKLEQRTEV